MTARSKKLLPAAIAAVLLLSGCEVVDDFELAMSGPHCGTFGFPAELENIDLDVLDHRFNWDRLDRMLAVLEPYEHTDGPDILWALGVLYMRKAVTLSNDPAYFRRSARLFRWAALCGNAPAVETLSGLYGEGLFGAEGITEEMFGVERNPELAACLHRAYEGNIYDYVPIPGRVWACGLRVENVTE